MTKYIQYVVRNKEPLRIADDSTSQSGQTVTLRYIPGTTIRGYVVNQLAQEKDFEQIKAKLFSDDIKYLNAYLCIKRGTQIRALMPSPKGFYEDKTEAIGKKELQNVVINGEFSDGMKRAALGRYCYIQDGCIYYCNVSTGSDMKIKIDKKGTADQSVFRNEYIEKDHYFIGYIAIKNDGSEESKKLQELAIRIKDLFSKELILGNARSSGFGKCQVISCKLVKEIPYEEYIPYRDQSNECYMMLLSNTILRNSKGELCGFTSDILKRLEEKMGVRDLNIQYCSTSTVNVRGYNRTWGTKLPSMMAYESGSLFHLKFQGHLTAEKMRMIMNEGIGIQKNSGFGRVLFLNDYADVKYKESKKYFEELEDVQTSVESEILDEDNKKTIEMAAKNYYKNMLKVKMEEYVLSMFDNKAGSNKKEQFLNLRTSNSQLGTMDSILTKYQYEPSKAKNELMMYLKHENEKKEKSNTHKAHNSLTNMENFVQIIFGRKINEIVGFDGRESGKIMGIPITELLSEYEEERMKIELIINLIRFKNKEEK